jgi:Tfp pilus assembly protein PilX
MSRKPARTQRGAALVVSLIMLVLITLLVITALNLGSANFRAVSNTQFRDQAIAAANAAIQSRVGSTFDALPVTTNIPVDLDNDGTPDFDVAVTPTCISAAVADSAEQSSVQLDPSLSLASTWNTVWDIAAAVTDADTGATMNIRAGVRVLLNQAERDTACPDPVGGGGGGGGGGEVEPGPEPEPEPVPGPDPVPAPEL